MARLVIEAGESAGRSCPLSGTMYIGRRKSADIPLDDSKASRKHVRLTQQGSDFYAEDAGSRNGTLFNGKPLASKVRLKSGDRLQIGQSVLRFEDGEGASRPQAARAPEAPAAVRAPERREERPAAPAAARRSGSAVGGFFRFLLLVGVFIAFLLLSKAVGDRVAEFLRGKGAPESSQGR